MVAAIAAAVVLLMAVLSALSPCTVFTMSVPVASVLWVLPPIHTTSVVLVQLVRLLLLSAHLLVSNVQLVRILVTSASPLVNHVWPVDLPAAMVRQLVLVVVRH